MARRVVKIWYDAEGDFLEVVVDRREGYFRETESVQVLEKVDAEGNVSGFSVFGVSSAKRSARDSHRFSTFSRQSGPGRLPCRRFAVSVVLSAPKTHLDFPLFSC